MTNQALRSRVLFDELAENLRLATGAANGPLLVVIDGRSGAGKSTLARDLSEVMESAVIPLDDFFSADIPDEVWDEMSVEQRRGRVFQWQRVRQQCLLPLLAGKPAQWHAFDFASGLRVDGTYGMEPEPTSRKPAPVIILEGAYASSPELSDLADVAVLVVAPAKVRRLRRARRDGDAFSQAWWERWGPVEDWYFTHLRPPAYFDLMVESGGRTGMLG